MPPRTSITLANWIATIAMAFLCLIVLFITIALVISVIRFLRSLQHRSISKSRTMIASLVTTFLYTISTIIFFIGSVHHILHSEADIYTEWFGTGLHLMSQTAMMFTFVSRVDITFRSSILRYSQGCIRVLYLLSIGSISFCVLDVVFMVLQMWLICYLTTAIWLLIFSVLSFALVYLFVRKMIEIAISSKCTKSSNSNLHSLERERSMSNSSTVKDMIDEELLFVATKHAALVSFAITSSFVLELLALFIAFMVSYHDWQPCATFWIALDSVINVLCNYLLFAFANPAYGVLCSPLHRACTACQVWSIEKKVRPKPNTEETTSAAPAVLDLAAITTSRTSVTLDGGTNDPVPPPITPTDA